MWFLTIASVVINSISVFKLNDGTTGTILSSMVAELNEIDEVSPCETELYPIYLDRTEKDNSKWLEMLVKALKDAKTFEIHCWNEEDEWIEMALKYGGLKESDWKYGKIITGIVTEEFSNMLLSMPKPQDNEIYNKMTPFFNVFLDDRFQSCHYGTEIYIEEKS